MELSALLFCICTKLFLHEFCSDPHAARGPSGVMLCKLPQFSALFLSLTVQANSFLRAREILLET